MKVLNDRGLIHQVEIIKGLFQDEAEQRSRQDETLRDKIDNEIQDREASDEELDEKIDQTKQEIEDAIEETLGDYATKQEVSLIPKFAIAVVNELPTEDISPTTVYLLVGGSEQGNLYTEYIYVNNAWETLGSQALDLTGYATKDWVSGVLQGYLSTDGGTMTGSIEWENGDGTFGIRETQADNPNKTTYDIGWNHQNRDGAGLGLRSSDSTLETGQFHLYARDDTQTSTLQGSPDGTLKWNTNIVNQDGTSTTVQRDVVVDVSEGQTNGTISVNGSDVPVHGLGSAAYTDSTEYASSSHTHNYLPLSGGKMKGVILSNANSNADSTSSTRIEEFVSSGRDKNGIDLGAEFYSTYAADTFHGLRTRNPNFNSGTNWGDIRLHVNEYGKTWINFEKHNSLTDGTTDNSNHIPTTAFIHGKYLSLSGGTMTGNLATDMDEFWIGNKKANNAGIITLRSANDSYKNGAVLTLHGIGASGAGQFTLQAADGTNTPSLLGKADGTLKWNNSDIALAKNVLPLSGGTLTGSLYTNGLYILKQPGVSTKGTNPSAWKEQSVRFADASGQVSDAHLLGMVRNEIATDGRVITRMVSYKNASGSSDNESIGIAYPASGDPYTFAPTPATSDNSSKIATTAYVKSNLQNYSTTSHTHSYIPLSGGTLTSGGYIHKKSSLTKGTKPSSTTWSLSNIVFDSAGTATADRLSEYRSFVDANGTTGTEILSYDFTSGATSNAYLSVRKLLNGEAYVSTNGQLVINRNNGSIGGGIKLTGAGQNFAISAQNTNVTKGTAPSSTAFWGIDFYGKDQDNYNKRIGMLETSLDANNLSSTHIRAYNCTTNTNTATSSIGVHVDGNGNAYTSAPTPATSDDSTKIATTAWVRNVAALASHTHSYLSLSGGTLNGNLLISKTDPNITLDKNNMTRATAPSAAVNKIDIHARDSADKSVWGIYSRYGTDKSNRVDLIAYKGTTTDNTWTGIGVGYDASGNWFTYAPTPVSSSNATHIATTAWVRGLFGSSSGIEGISAIGNYYVRYASGVQICWGVTESSTTTVTFPVAFKDTNIAIIQGDLNSSRADRMTYDEKRIDSWTTTGFVYHNGCCQRGYIAIGKWK